MAASVEEKKIKYSQELAAYTLRQWNAVRSSPDPAEKQTNRRQSKSRQGAERGQENRDKQSPERGETQSNGQTTSGGRRDNTGRRSSGFRISSLLKRRDPDEGVTELTKQVQRVSLV